MVNYNRVSIYGCPISARIVSNLTMISNLIEQIKQDFDKQALTIEFPKVLNALQEKSPGLKVVTGGHIQTMHLSLQTYNATYSKAIIFAENENEMINSANSIFDQVLQFQQVEICTDYTKI